MVTGSSLLPIFLRAEVATKPIILGCFLITGVLYFEQKTQWQEKETDMNDEEAKKEGGYFLDQIQGPGCL